MRWRWRPAPTPHSPGAASPKSSTACAARRSSPANRASSSSRICRPRPPTARRCSHASATARPIPNRTWCSRSMRSGSSTATSWPAWRRSTAAASSAACWRRSLTVASSCAASSPTPRSARAAGPRLVCSGIFNGDTLLGFICTLDDGVQALAHHIGFDRIAAQQQPLYLRLLDQHRRCDRDRRARTLARPHRARTEVAPGRHRACDGRVGAAPPADDEPACAAAAVAGAARRSAGDATHQIRRMTTPRLTSLAVLRPLKGPFVALGDAGPLGAARRVP